jgi:hypothetical protein
MKRIAVIGCALLGLALTATPSRASWGSAGYSGYQPWYNIFAKRYKCLTPEEERLQKFWHDYYDALHHFYGALDHIDWVAYYKNHGYQINCGSGGPGCCGRINYAPVFVSPNMQWAVPNTPACGPPSGPCGPGMFGPMPIPYGPIPGPGPGGALPPGPVAGPGPVPAPAGH